MGSSTGRGILMLSKILFLIFLIKITQVVSCEENVDVPEPHEDTIEGKHFTVVVYEVSNNRLNNDYY